MEHRPEVVCGMVYEIYIDRRPEFQYAFTDHPSVGDTVALPDEDNSRFVIEKVVDNKIYLRK